MNKIKCMLLDEVLGHPRGKPVSLQEIAAALDISQRMVRIYWGEIEKFLSQHSLGHMFILQNAAVSFVGSRMDEQRLHRALMAMDMYEYRSSPEERQLLMVLYLLGCGRPVKINELEHMFSISKATVIQDLAVIKQTDSEFSLKFDKNKHAGLRLECTEFQRRAQIFGVLEQFGLIHSYPWDCVCCVQCVYVGFVEKIYELDVFRRQVQAALRHAETQTGCLLEDADYFEAVLRLCVVQRCIEQNNTVQEKDVPIFSESFRLECAFVDVLEQQMSSFKFVPAERRYLENMLHPFLHAIRRSAQDFNRLNYYVMVANFLSHLAQDYGEYISQDEQLQEGLTFHLLRTFSTGRKEAAPNPYKEQLMRDYAQDFSAVKRAASVLEQGLYCTLDENEISFLLLHVIVAVERRARKLPVLDVVIVCNSGMGTSQYLAASLQKNFQIHVLSVTSTHLLDSTLQENHCDLVISTVPLEGGLPVPWLQTSLPLSEWEISQLQRTITMICSQRIMEEQSTLVSTPVEREGHVLYFTDLLGENSIVLDAHADDWRQAIRLAGEPLCRTGAAQPTYVEEMVRVVEQLGPYIVFTPGVALAHARPLNGVECIGAAFLRLARPVKFYCGEYDPVEFVLAVCVPPQHQDTRFLPRIMTAMCDRQIRRMLLNADNTFKIRALLREKEEALIRQKKFLQ